MEILLVIAGIILFEVGVKAEGIFLIGLGLFMDEFIGVVMWIVDKICGVVENETELDPNEKH